MEQPLYGADRETEQLLSCFLDMGELLLTSGAEVVRVEDTLTRLCHAYGFTRADVFTITSSIVLTVHCADGRILTQTRRIKLRSTDLDRIAQTNALSRKLCAKPLSVNEVLQSLEDIRQRPQYPAWAQFLAYGIISAAFSLFFGGTYLDAAGACLSGIFLFLMQMLIKPLRINSILQDLIISAVTALAAVLLTKLGIGHNPASMTIGNIMLLIPGVAFTTALRDIINGDTISGLLGISEAVIKALAVAIGFAGVLVQIGGAL